MIDMMLAEGVNKIYSSFDPAPRNAINSPALSATKSIAASRRSSAILSLAILDLLNILRLNLK